MGEKLVFSSKILIVDDQQSDAELIHRMLEHTGFTNIQWQSRAIEALEAVDDWQPDLVLLDLHLGGASGLDVLKSIRERTAGMAGLPVLVCTGDTEIEPRRLALTLGATDFLIKPVDLIELGKRVENLIEAYLLRRDLEARVAQRIEDYQVLNKTLEVEILGRKKVEHALRQTEQRLRFLLSSGAVTVYTCEPYSPFTPTFVSPNVLARLGYEPEEFTLDPNFWLERVHPDDRTKLGFTMPGFADGDRIVQEYRFRHKDGSYRWIGDDPVVVKDNEGKPIEIVGAWIDISDRVVAQESLADHSAMLENANTRLKEFDRLKSEFVATASHEMRTPLTVIREFASQLNDGLAGNIEGEQREMIVSMIRNCDRLTGLLDNLLDLHKIEARQIDMSREKTDLTKTIRDCYRDFAVKCHAGGVDLVLQVERNLPPVFCDSDLISQVLVNLLSNACRFTSRGGTITLSAKAVRGCLAVCVADTGRGIAAADLAKVFEAFTQVERTDGPGYRGTGLGLTISKKILEMHGSEIKVTSALGLGSEFSFELPIWAPDEGLAEFICERWMMKSAGGLIVLRSLNETQATESGLLAQVIGRVVISCPTSPGALRLASSCLVAAILDTDVASAQKVLKVIVSGDDGISHSDIQCALVGFEPNRGLDYWLEKIEASFKSIVAV